MDERLLLFINGMRAPWLDAVASPITEYGIYALPLAMLFALARSLGHARSIRDGWLTWFLSMLVCEQILKPLIGRARPTAGERLREALDVLGSVPPPSSLGFPSGSATVAFAAPTWIWLRWGWRPGAPAVVFAALVALSRVYAGIHWPTDVLGGAVLGAAVAVGLDGVGKRVDTLHPAPEQE